MPLRLSKVLFALGVGDFQKKENFNNGHPLIYFWSLYNMHAKSHNVRSINILKSMVDLKGRDERKMVGSLMRLNQGSSELLPT